MIMTDLSTDIFSNTAVSPSGTTRWMSPELLNAYSLGLDGPPSRESDCYALGMTIYQVSGFLFFGAIPFTHLQVLSGLPPFFHLWSPVVACAVLVGERPKQPPNASSLGFTNTLWGLLQSCWSESASARPTSQQLLDYLQPASLTWIPPSRLSPSPATGGIVDSFGSDTTSASGESRSGSVCRVQ